MILRCYPNVSAILRRHTKSGAGTVITYKQNIIGRAGASPPSRATGAIFLYIYIYNIYMTDRVHTYRIVLNVSTRFYFSVYTTFHWSLVRLAVFVTVNSRAPCLLTPCTHLGHHQLRQCQVYNRPFLVLERSQLLLRFASTNNYAMRFLR